MKITLELPGDERAQIENYLADLDAEIAMATEKQRALTGEIAELETSAENLRHEIAQLQPEAISSDKIAGVLAVKESRLRQVSARLVVLCADLDQLPPVTLASATPVVNALVSFYFTNLPERIADWLAEMNLCHNRSRAIFAAKHLDCVTVLRPIKTWASGIIVRPATPENLAKLRAIFNRALRGQVNLAANDEVEVVEAPNDQTQEAIPQ